MRQARINCLAGTNLARSVSVGVLTGKRQEITVGATRFSDLSVVVACLNKTEGSVIVSIAEPFFFSSETTGLPPFDKSIRYSKQAVAGFVFTPCQPETARRGDCGETVIVDAAQVAAINPSGKEFAFVYDIRIQIDAGSIWFF